MKNMIAARNHDSAFAVQVTVRWITYATSTFVLIQPSARKADATLLTQLLRRRRACRVRTCGPVYAERWREIAEDRARPA
ncbi:hypothetical protein FRC12_003705 [Ceratobasidium sp. 428]|nr:hypothetical protein FRC12_003705 [Ceratobasidium sp. 428]